jgi:hypothetical protein
MMQDYPCQRRSVCRCRQIYPENGAHCEIARYRPVTE